MKDNVIELSEANFEQEVLAAPNPVLVQFWAKWSKPCQAMMPLLESLAGDNPVPLKLARLNVERQDKVAEEYGVRAVPTLLIFNQGGLRDQIIGRTTEWEIRERLEQFKRAER